MFDFIYFHYIISPNVRIESKTARHKEKGKRTVKGFVNWKVLAEKLESEDDIAEIVVTEKGIQYRMVEKE